MDTVRLGRGIRALRMRRGWRQRDLATVARVSQSLIARVEGGRGDRLKAATLDRVVACLGARLVVRIDWNGEALDRLLDERHASDVEQVVVTARQLGWEVIPEATFSIRGERGSVDVLAWHPKSSTLLVCEVKSVMPDVQATLSILDRKVRLGYDLAAAHGWRPTRIARLLVIEDGRTSRRRVEAHAATFAARFPDRTVTVRRFLADPGSRASLNGLWFLSTRTTATPRHRVAGRSWIGRAQSRATRGVEIGNESSAQRSDMSPLTKSRSSTG